MTIELVPFPTGESIRMNGAELLWIGNGSALGGQDLYEVLKKVVDEAYEDGKEDGFGLGQDNCGCEECDCD